MVGIISFYSPNPQENLEEREEVKVSGADLTETLEQLRMDATSVTLIFSSHNMEVSICDLQTWEDSMK